MDDNFVEGDEMFFVSLRSLSGDQVELGKPNSASVRIMDNDGIVCTHTHTHTHTNAHTQL